MPIPKWILAPMATGSSLGMGTAPRGWSTLTVLTLTVSSRSPAATQTFAWRRTPYRVFRRGQNLWHQPEFRLPWAGALRRERRWHGPAPNHRAHCLGRFLRADRSGIDT